MNNTKIKPKTKPKTKPKNKPKTNPKTKPTTNPKKHSKSHKTSSTPKRAGGSLLPTYDDLTNTSYLYGNTQSEYQEFDYNNAIKKLKLSNFAGGKKMKMKNVLKTTYTDYKKGKRSKLAKKTKGGDTNALPISVKDTYNVSHLDYDKPYSYLPVERIDRVPYSHLAIY